MDQQPKEKRKRKNFDECETEFTEFRHQTIEYGLKLLKSSTEQKRTRERCGRLEFNLCIIWWTFERITENIRQEIKVRKKKKDKVTPTKDKCTKNEVIKTEDETGRTRLYLSYLRIQIYNTELKNITVKLIEYIILQENLKGRK